MSKIICDVCGTAYPETSTQCPICGCVRTADVSDVLADNTAESSARTYTYVKGGRFSKANVKKRNRANQSTESTTAASRTASQHKKQQGKKSNMGLVITAIVLLLAIVAVVIYLALKLFWPALPSGDDSSEPPVQEQTGTVEAVVACEEIVLDVSEVVFDEVGTARMIYATPTPANTTDTISFSSSDESVATVTNGGKVVAVGAGEAVITVTCGDMRATCTVICEIAEPTEETMEETTEETTIAAVDFRLNREDITFSFKGEEWMLYSGSLDVSQITWSSDNESVATIENGTVKAVGSGTTTVYGEYNGVKVSCIIRCSFTNSDYQGVGGHGGAGADGEG